MDTVSLALLILLVMFLFGGIGWPRPADGPATISTVLYVLAVVVVIVLLVRLLGALALTVLLPLASLLAGLHGGLG